MWGFVHLDARSCVDCYPLKNLTGIAHGCVVRVGGRCFIHTLGRCCVYVAFSVPGCLWEPGVLVLTWHGLVRVAAGSSGWVAWAVCSSEGSMIVIVALC